MEENNKSKVISSLAWKFFERIGTQGVQFIVSIILARLLLPSDYGAITMITVFIAISNTFIQSGFSTSLIQKQNADDLDFSSVFYASLIIAAMFYIALFFAAPAIANFYEMSIIKDVLRVLALTLFIGAINSVQNAKISKDMKFKKLFISSIGAILFSGTVGVVMAYKGYGVWALVAQQIVNQVMSTIILWFTSGWKPKLMFSFQRLKGLISYGWKILCSGLIDTIYQNSYNLVVGKAFNSETLGLYNKGEQFPKLISVNIDGAIGSVMLPAYAKEQEKKDKVKKMVRRAIVTSSLIIFPMMFGLAAVASSVVEILLTSKWSGCVIFMQIMCLVYALYPINTANLQAIKALGKSNYYLKMEIIKKVIGILALIVTIRFGIVVMVLAQAGVAIISSFINAYPNKKLLDYSYIEQIKDIAPTFLIALFMGIVVYVLNIININVYLLLSIQIIIGAIIYITLISIFKLESFTYLVSTIKEIFNSRRGKNVKN